MNHWEDEGLCHRPASAKAPHDPNYFEQYEQDVEVAKEVDDTCLDCPVRLQCLTMGIQTAGTGVHGAVYLNLGKYSRARNAHKDPYIAKKLQEDMAKIKAGEL